VIFLFEVIVLKKYEGTVPACGIFCGGCPVYVREKKPCPGAEINCARCRKCKSFYLCCENKGIRHCYECEKFPCSRFKQFRKTWLKYGQDMIENQHNLKELGEETFLKSFNEQIEKEKENKNG